MEYRYYLEGSHHNGAKVLARGNTRQQKHICCNPDCRKKSLVKFVDITTNEYLDGSYGKCDHEGKCGYSRWPDKDSKTGSLLTDTEHLKPVNIPATLTFIPEFILNATLKGYDQNTFITNLLTNIPFPFSESDVVDVINLYHLGTVTKGYRKGAVTFPYIDIDEQVRAIQVKQFDKSNHTTTTDYIHSIIEKDCKQNGKKLPEWLSGYLKNEKYVSCPFGEHLLRLYPANPIILVEAPKTAIVGTLYFGFPDNPDNLLWLAVYNRSSLNYDKCKFLRGRKVVIYPDLGAYQDWLTKIEGIEKLLPDTTFAVSDLLESAANETDIKDGLDLADYLINFDWREFREPTVANSEIIWPVEAGALEPPLNKDLHKSNIVPVSDWPVDELEDYFKKHTNWPAQIMLDKASTIFNPEKFIGSHLSTIRRNNGNPTFQPFLNRLQQLQKLNLTNPIHTQATMCDASFKIMRKNFTSNSDWEHG